jgi:D-xylulose reductase
MFAFKLPENVGYDEGALVEPLAVGLHAARKARIKPGDVALVTGAGTIGLVTAMAALAGGCSKVIITDIVQQKLDLASRFGMVPVNVTRQNLNDIVSGITDGWGADVVFEASGNEAAISRIFEPLCPGGRVVFIGMPVSPVPIDIVSAQAKEARIETIFRYAHVYPRALSLMESGKLDLKPLITDRYRFEESIAAFEYAANPKPTTVKVVIEL